MLFVKVKVSPSHVTQSKYMYSLRFLQRQNSVKSFLARCGWEIEATPGPLYPRGNDPEPIVLEAWVGSRVGLDGYLEKIVTLPD